MSCFWNLRSKPMSCFSCSAFISNWLFSMPTPFNSDIIAATASLKPAMSALVLLAAALSDLDPARLSAADDAKRSCKIFICSRSVRSLSTSCAFSRLARMPTSSKERLASSSCRSRSIRSASHCRFATSKVSLCFDRSLSRTSRAFVDKASASWSFRCSAAWRSSLDVRSSSQSRCALSVIRGKIHDAMTSCCAGPPVCCK
mmetsp:Transcript_27273/g.78501  ORF Transcript_27273/g.78501 Transcript_27273/m.78501 type:complete len:201 (-) Transcript_27273:1430-2032(-)